MDRLTEKELYDGKVRFTKCAKTDCPEKCAYCDIPEEARLKLKEYEDLENKGLLLKLPCKVGADIFRIANNQIYSNWQVAYFEVFMDEIVIVDDSENKFTIGKIGKTVFLTREEAERKLKEMEV